MTTPVTKTLSNPTVQINDTTISIEPNSCSYKKGFGDVNVKVQSAGGSSVEPVVTENAESKKSMVKFKLLNTDNNFKLADYWLEQRTVGVTIDLSEGTIAEGFDKMIFITEPERMIGADGNLEIIFEGAPNV